MQKIHSPPCLFLSSCIEAQASSNTINSVSPITESMDFPALCIFGPRGSVRHTSKSAKETVGSQQLSNEASRSLSGSFDRRPHMTCVSRDAVLNARLCPVSPSPGFRLRHAFSPRISSVVLPRQIYRKASHLLSPSQNLIASCRLKSPERRRAV